MSKKAWLDLACWFKNKVWVGAWGLQYYFFLCFFTFLARVGKKKPFKLVSACFSSASGNGEASGLEAQGDPGLAPVPSTQSQGRAV